MVRTKTVATRSVGTRPQDKQLVKKYTFKHVLRRGEIQLIVLTQGGLSLKERGKLGIALGHGASDLRKQTKELHYGRPNSIMYPLEKKKKND